jgi:transposase-like protein
VSRRTQRDPVAAFDPERLRKRGMKDTFFVVCDGLKGLLEVVSNVWPQAIVQTCIIHLIRNTFRLTSRKYRDEIKRDLRPIYTTVNAAAARAAFDELDHKWGQRYPAMIRLWSVLARRSCIDAIPRGCARCMSNPASDKASTAQYHP